jgi:type II secretion system protein J
VKNKRRVLKKEPVNNSGFTLIEIIISTLIMSIIVMIILPVFMSIMEVKNQMELRGTRQIREAQALISLMQKDLRSAFLPKRESEDEDNDNDKFIIINARDLEGRAYDAIYFSSFSHYMADGADKFSDQCEIGYFIKEEDDIKTLYRKESRIVDSDLIEGGEEIKLTDSITYFDIVAYSEGFIEEEISQDEDPIINTFPKGVLVRLGLKTKDGMVREYETAIDMPAYFVSEEEDNEDEEKEEDKETEEEEEEDGHEDEEEDTGGENEPEAE